MLGGILTACALTPSHVAVNLDDGRTLQGVAAGNGEFSVQDDVSGLTCSGSYSPSDHARNLVVLFECSDGNVGAADLVRDPDLVSGTGRVTLADGSGGNLYFSSNVDRAVVTTAERAVGAPLVIADVAALGGKNNN
jgi:hypothetical protein